MSNAHPFVVKLTFDDRVDHVFLDTREQCVTLLKSIQDNYKDGISAMTDDVVITLMNFQKAEIIEKPVDVSDMKWLG